MKTKNLTKWDALEHLESEEDMVAYLEAGLAENDPALIMAILDDVARATGRTQVAILAGKTNLLIPFTGKRKETQ